VILERGQHLKYFPYAFTERELKGRLDALVAK